VRFLARGEGYTLFLTDTEAVLALRGATEPLFNSPLAKGGQRGVVSFPQLSIFSGWRFPPFEKGGQGGFWRRIISTNPPQSPPSAKLRTGFFKGGTSDPISAQENDATPPVIHMRLVNANPTPVVEGMEERRGKAHYYIGNDPAKWRRNITTYGKVRYRDIYPGIDLIYYGKGSQFEHDFIVAPRVDPARIRLAFQGAERMEIDSKGDLVLHAGLGEIRLRKPRVYQYVEGRRQHLQGEYTLLDNAEVGFRLATYDRERTLIIDPFVEVYLTYLGSSMVENPNSGNGGIAVDAEGYAYVTGQTTFGADFPPAGATDSTFVSKLDPTGSELLWSVFLPGQGNAIALDADRNVYVAGDTTAASSDFPTPGGFDTTIAGTDAFLAKLDSSGNLLYGTVFGGEGQDEAFGVAVDPDGNAYIAGQTFSSLLDTKSPDPAGPFQPLFGGFVDYFVAKFDPTKSGSDSLVYSTYLGGNALDQTFEQLIAVDALGNAYVTGYTASTDFLDPGCGQNFLNGFVVKLNPLGSDLIYSTCLLAMEGSGIAVDVNGNAYVTGEAYPGFPEVDPLPGTDCTDGGPFVTKLSFDETTSTLSTDFASCDVGGDDIAVDGAGRIYLGDTLLDLSKSGADRIVYSNVGLGGIDVDVDASCNAYVTGDRMGVPAGHGPIGPFQVTNTGSDDAYVAKVGKAGPLAYITNFNRDRVTVLDTATSALHDLDSSTAGTQAEIPVGDGPFGVAILPVTLTDYRVYVTNQTANSVSVIDSVSHTVTNTITGFNLPAGIAVSPSADRIFVANQGGNSVSILSTTNALDSSISPNPVTVGSGPTGLAAVRVGSKTKVYVANQFGNSVSVITLTGGSAAVTTLSSGFGFQGPTGVAITPETETAPPKVYVTNGFHTFVSVIDAETDTAMGTVPVGDNPRGVAASADGARVYVSNWYPLGLGGGNTVSVIDTATDTAADTGIFNGQIEVGGGPYGLAVHPDGSRVYVANSANLKCTEPSATCDEYAGSPPGDDVPDTISVINTATNTTVVSIDLDPTNTLFPQPTAFGEFIAPLAAIDPECIPLQPLMLLGGLENDIMEMSLPEGVTEKSLLNPLKSVRKKIERAQFDKAERKINKFITKVMKKLPGAAGEGLITKATQILNAVPPTDA
jgi:YVTN family beta-propeller protein